jgi:hypothetical protein
MGTLMSWDGGSHTLVERRATAGLFARGLGGRDVVDFVKWIGRARRGVFNVDVAEGIWRMLLVHLVEGVVFFIVFVALARDCGCEEGCEVETAGLQSSKLGRH